MTDKEWQEALAYAQQLLSVTQEAFPRTIQGEAALLALNTAFEGELPEGRRVQAMPLACRIGPDGERYWTGADVVLGPLATDPPPTFELRAETLCTGLTVDGGRVRGARVRDMVSGAESTLHPRVVVVACDGLRTPQLLWASGIRPRALGRYLNDHIQLMGAALLDPGLVARAAAELDGREYAEARGEAGDPLVGVFWIPYSERHPFHGQVMHLDMSPIAVGPADAANPGRIVGLGYFIPKEIRFEDRVEFSDTDLDVYGMPKIRITYELTPRDHSAIAAATEFEARAAAALGGFAPGREPTLMPAGSSLHYQGSVRMGERDDGESVCGPYSRVWGIENLYVGGNGVIPTPTAGNPTLASVAHAVRAARNLVMDLDA